MKEYHAIASEALFDFLAQKDREAGYFPARSTGPLASDLHVYPDVETRDKMIEVQGGDKVTVIVLQERR